MKKKLSLIILFLLTLTYLGGSADWTGWTADRLSYGEHVTTTWTFTGYIEPSSQCTTAWVQISYNAGAVYDSNKTVIQNAPNYFANFVSVDTTAAADAGNDSAKILWARCDVAIDTGLGGASSAAYVGRKFYQTADSTNFWICNRDLLPTLYPSGRTDRVYEMYVVGGDFIRYILKNGTAQTISYTIKTKGINQ